MANLLKRLKIDNGVYTAEISCKSSFEVAVLCNEEHLETLTVPDPSRGKSRITIELPKIDIGSNRHCFTIVENETGNLLDGFSIGLDPDAEIHVELDTLRAELDLLKRVVRSEIRKSK